jgi:hypothetical protein
LASIHLYLFSYATAIAIALEDRAHETIDPNRVISSPNSAITNEVNNFNGWYIEDHLSNILWGEEGAIILAEIQVLPEQHLQLNWRTILL